MFPKVKTKYKNYVDFNCKQLITDLQDIQKKYPKSDMRDIFIKTSSHAFKHRFECPRARIGMSGSLEIYNDIGDCIYNNLNDSRFKSKHFNAVLRK